MKFTTLFFSALILVSVPAVTLAGPIVRSGDSVSISAEQVLEGDFYALGGDVSLSGEAKADAYLMGNTVTVNAPTAVDLTILGASVQVHAPVGDDVRITGGTVVLASAVKGDVVVLGGTLKVLSTAEVGGDILFLGGQLEVEGPVAGSIYGRAESVRIDAPVGGDIRVQATRGMSLGDKANISGSVTYTSILDIARAQNAVVVGDVTKESPVMIDDSSPVSFVIPLLVQLFTALALFMLMRGRIQTLTGAVSTRYGMLGLTGLAILVGVPVLAAILMVSVIGAVVGVALFLTYVLFIIGAWSLTGVVCGTLLLRPLTHSDEVTLMSASLGTALFMLLWFVPIIGPIIGFIAFLSVLGGLSMQFYRSFR